MNFFAQLKSGKSSLRDLLPAILGSQLKPLLEKAVAAGIWYNPELIRTVLEAAGE